MRLSRRALLGIAAAFPAVAQTPALTGAACAIPRPAAATRMSVLAFRFPAIEYVTAAMRDCARVGNLEVELRLVSFGALLEQSNITLQGGGVAPFDVLHSYNTLMWEQAGRDWLAPLDELIAKHRDAYALTDIPQPTWAASSFGGKVYGLPFQQNTQILFMNEQIMRRAGVAPPATMEEWFIALDLLKRAGGMRAPLALAFQGAAGMATEFHNALHAHDGAWLNPDNTPAFNSPAGRNAIETLRRLIGFGPPNMLQMSNDDVQVALQQGQVAMSNLWLTRAAQMDDRQMSRVAGNIQFVPSPIGDGGRPYSTFTVDMFVVPKGARSVEQSFLLVADALRADRLRGAAPLTMVPRDSLARDEDLRRSLRWLYASAENIRNRAAAAPAVPFFTTMRAAVGQALIEGIQQNRAPADILAKAQDDTVRVLREQGHLR
jgi:ABC-type glycerol-3-phosphate transport system substrate-binding protein